MKILIACEESGTVRDAFIAKGHDAMSCDIIPSRKPRPHYQGNVFDILNDGWDMMIAHPPCTYLTVTGNKWFYNPADKNLAIELRRPHPRFPNRRQQREEAVDFFMALAQAPIDKICIENPAGIISTWWRKPDQYIHPYYFGDPHSKRTGLWLKGLQPLTPTKMVEPEWYIYKNGKRDPLWHVETMKLSAEERTKERSKTFQGIADAMADQWG